MDMYRIEKCVKAVFLGGIVTAIVCLARFGWNTLNPPKEVTAQYTTIEIMLSNGHKVVADVTRGDGKIFIPQDTLSEILNKDVQWNKQDQVLYIGDIPNAQIMSQTLGMPYHKEAIKTWYGAQVSIDKIMTMGNQKYSLGYSFENTRSVQYNLAGNYSKLATVIGVQDNTCTSEGIVEIYLDNQLYRSINIDPKQLPQKLVLDIAGANQMSFIFKDFTDTAVINFADIYIK